jgi:TRAP-type C4-dicarboxylate transport system permease small subunit
MESLEASFTRPWKEEEMFSALDKFVARVTTSFAVVGATLIGLLGLLVVTDVVGRNFGFPVVGVVELAAQTVVISAFLTIPFVMRKGSHIRATVLVSRLPDVWRRGFEALAFAIGVVVFALLAYSSWESFLTDLSAGSYEGEGALRVPTWPARLTIFLASALMVVEGILSVIKTIMGEKK